MQLGAHQFAPLDDAYRQKFDARVAAYLRQHHAACSVHSPRASFTIAELPDDVLMKLVAIALQRGRQHGLIWQSSLNAFATLMVKVAPNFDQHPKVAQTLAAELRPADFGMRELPTLMTPADWRAAALAYDPGAWVGEAPPS
jgi:hypothetical protein